MALSTFLLLLNGREAMDLVKLALYSVHEWSVERRLDVFERHPQESRFYTLQNQKSDQNLPWFRSCFRAVVQNQIGMKLSPRDKRTSLA